MQKNDMDVYEASDFWDEHNFLEFDDVTEIKDFRFTFPKKKYIGIDLGLYNNIKKEALRLRKTEGVLINEWLTERVEHHQLATK